MSKTIVARIFLLILLLAGAAAEAAPIQVSAARVWPGTDYTRLTFESTVPVVHKMTVLQNPHRIVLDLNNVELNGALRALSDKVQDGDPYIQKIRSAYFKPGVLRVVVELKTETRPSFFALKPAGAYQHRLVLDIYPKLDPLMAMLDKHTRGQEEAAPGPSMPAATDAPASLDAMPSVVEDGNAGIPQEPALAENPEAADEARGEAGGYDPEAGGKPAVGKDGMERLVIVAIDAGHGGEDPGAKGATGTFEKDITLSIAKRLKALLDAEPNMRGVLTRDSDYFIPLHGRVTKARKLQADLFVSIHADAFTRPEARGSSVFALSERGATSAMARMLAKRENESDLIGGVNLDVKDPYLARTLLDLSQTATISDSLKLGKAVLGHLGEINTLHKPAVEQAGFAVLKSPDIPSILVETAFISNPEEERKLNDEAYQHKLATAIVTGIKKYFASNPPLSKSRVALQ